MSRARPDPAQLRQFVAQLRPGTVLRLYQPIAEKVKRHVLIASGPDRSLAFIINTQPSPFIRAREELRQRQVLMRVADHPFMQHDSFIACHDTVRLPAAPELARLLYEREAQVLGALSTSLYALITRAVTGSSLIAERDMKVIMAAFPAVCVTGA